MSSSPRGQKTHTLTHRTLATLGLLGLLSAGVVVGQSSEAFANGCTLDGVDGPSSPNAGDPSNPFAVGDEEDLKEVGVTCGLEKAYKQVNDIIMTPPTGGETSNHTPIGADNLSQNRFTGVYDGATDSGGTHTITGLTVDKSANFAGLFGAISSDAEVKNLALVGVSIKGDRYTGGIVGQNRGTITNVHVTSGRVEGTRYVGGLVGETAEGTISSSTSGTAQGESLEIEGVETVAGFAGEMSSGLIENSISHASVEGRDYVAGFVAGIYGGTIRNSHATGDATAELYGAAGFVVEFNADAAAGIESSSASGNVEVTQGNSEWAGGFVGVFSVGSITSSFASGDVTVTVAENQAFEGVGGFAGVLNNSDAVIASSYATGAISAPESDAVGGFVGSMEDGQVSDSYSTGNVTGANQVGGFVGLNDTNAAINTSYSLGSAEGADGASHVGGFAGENKGNITNSFWDTDASGLEGRDGVDDGATGKTTVDMTSITTFNDTNTEGLTTSWAIVAASAFEQPTGPANQIWGIGAGVNCGYPFLYWQTESAIACETGGGGGGTDSSQAEGSTSSSGSSPEKQASSPAIHLDLQAAVGQQVAGTTVVVGGQGLAPGSTMTLVVRSTPQTLVRGTVSSLGNFSAKINLPALAPGSHTLTLSGTAPDGSLVTLTQGFTISATGTFSALGTVAGGQTTGLAVTGPAASLMWSGIAGLGLLFAGLALTAAKNGLRIRRSL